MNFEPGSFLAGVAVGLLVWAGVVIVVVVHMWREIDRTGFK